MAWYKQRGAVVTMIILVILSFFSGIALGSPDSSKSPVTKNTSPTPNKSSTPEATKPISLSGNGETATDKFTLTSGLATVKLTHSGSSNFIVDLLDSQGNSVDGSLVNVIGVFQGSDAIRIPTDGQYLLNIQADGAWTATITQ